MHKSEVLVFIDLYTNMNFSFSQTSSSAIVDAANKLFDAIDENERCDIIVSNLLFDDLLASSNEPSVTHVNKFDKNVENQMI